ncbi:MAG: pilus assembly protein N-terminal domain-containing protein [Planctomycetales bacterium]|nr:pilus assembly protein N-terminal domain-containing protein [Planctomycetales bacterium]
MYRLFSPRRARLGRICATVVLAATTVLGPAAPSTWAAPGASVIRNVAKTNERLEMTVNTSQILTLDTRIPRMVVNNPELVTVTAISENQVQVAARKPGVTQINLWDENGDVHTVDLLIFGDVRELEVQLKRMFPGSSLRVVRLTNSLVLEGQVDRPEIVSVVRTLAEDYAPKVVNNITVGGVQQIVLKVKIMEVSRTKLRRMGTDFAIFGSDGFFASSVSDIIQSVSSASGSATGVGTTVDFGVIGDNTKFLGFLDWLQQNNVSKVLADPTLTTVSGRPASFNVGGELPILVPQGLGNVAIEYKKFGTQVDFVPIVLGDGNIRLEVRPRVSEVDDSRSVTVNSFSVPALKVREVDTGVEMKAGQTLAIAGLIQERIESVHRGLPFISDLPVIGLPFRKVQESVNEIELLILVTPDFAGALDPHEVPQCGPGMETMSPSHAELYCKGYIEVPSCGPCGAMCGTPPCGPGAACQTGGCQLGGPTAMGSNGYEMPGGTPIMATDGDNGYPSSGYPSGEYIMPATGEPSLAPEPATSDADDLPDPSADASPQNRHNRTVRTAAGKRLRRPTATPGLIGPVGYDVQK